MNEYLSVLTEYEPLNQLLRTGIRPSLLVNGTKNARSLIFFQHVESRIIFQGMVLGEETANGLAIDFASGEVDEALAILPAVLHHRKGIHEVAVDGVQRTGVVISWSAYRSQVDHLHKSTSAKISLNEVHRPPLFKLQNKLSNSRQHHSAC